jgi:hypothetical protein
MRNLSPAYNSRFIYCSHAKDLGGVLGAGVLVSSRVRFVFLRGRLLSMPRARKGTKVASLINLGFSGFVAEAWGRNYYLCRESPLFQEGGLIKLWPHQKQFCFHKPPAFVATIKPKQCRVENEKGKHNWEKIDLNCERVSNHSLQVTKRAGSIEGEIQLGPLIKSSLSFLPPEYILSCSLESLLLIHSNQSLKFHFT